MMDTGAEWMHKRRHKKEERKFEEYVSFVRGGLDTAFDVFRKQPDWLHMDRFDRRANVGNYFNITEAAELIIMKFASATRHIHDKKRYDQAVRFLAKILYENRVRRGNVRVMDIDKEGERRLKAFEQQIPEYIQYEMKKREKEEEKSALREDKYVRDLEELDESIEGDKVRYYIERLDAETVNKIILMANDLYDYVKDHADEWYGTIVNFDGSRKIAQGAHAQAEILKRIDKRPSPRVKEYMATVDSLTRCTSDDNDMDVDVRYTRVTKEEAHHAYIKLLDKSYAKKFITLVDTRDGDLYPKLGIKETCNRLNSDLASMDPITRKYTKVVWSRMCMNCPTKEEYMTAATVYLKISQLFFTHRDSVFRKMYRRSHP